MENVGKEPKKIVSVFAGEKSEMKLRRKSINSSPGNDQKIVGCH